MNSELIRSFLEKEDRKQFYLSKRLNCSDATVDRMLVGHVPKMRTVEALAQLMGVKVDSLLIPKEAKRA